MDKISKTFNHNTKVINLYKTRKQHSGSGKYNGGMATITFGHCGLKKKQKVHYRKF